MARGRMLSTKIAEDEDFNRMSVDAQFMFMRTVPHLDRDGIITGNPTLLWAKIAPLLPQYADKVCDMIAEWVAAGFVLHYTDEKKRSALLFKGFTKNQSGLRYDREARSEFGVPPGYRWTPGGLVEIECAREQNGEANEPADRPPTNSGKTPAIVPPEVEDQVEDQDQSTLESGNENGSHAPAREDSAEVLENAAQEPQTLKLMRQWSRDKPKPVKVRMNAQQAAIVAATSPTADPPPRVQAAGPLPPMVNPNRVIGTPTGEQIIIEKSAWTEMRGVLLDMFGWRELASAGVKRVTQDAEITLETLCKMSPKFRTKSGLLDLCASWEKAKPDYPVPKPAWLEDHAGLFLAGKVRYPGGKHEKRSPGSDGIRAENEALPDRSPTFNYSEWLEERAAGKYDNEPY